MRLAVACLIVLLAVAAVHAVDEDDELLETKPLGEPLPERMHSLEREWDEDVGQRAPADENADAPPAAAEDADAVDPAAEEPAEAHPTPKPPVDESAPPTKRASGGPSSATHAPAHGAVGPKAGKAGSMKPTPAESPSEE
jgi:hypothetical protein